LTTIILTLVGILLAAAAALMILFYGGQTYDKGVLGAAASTLQNAGTNVLVASQMFRSGEGRAAASMSELAASRKYLAEVPKVNATSRANDATAMSFDGSQFLVALGDTDMDREICARVNRNLGNGFVAGGQPPRFEDVPDMSRLPKMGCGSYDEAKGRAYVFFALAERDT
jgi:hypothetical protein